MDCGKSTLALQLRHTYLRSGRNVLMYSVGDRVDGSVTSRVGISAPALTLNPDINIHLDIALRAAETHRIDDVIVDESQFLTVDQVDQLGHVVDEMDINVRAFGIKADFTGALFSGSRRLFEIADECHQLQVESMCWCGSRGVFNARVVNGLVTHEGPQVLIGDTDAAAEVFYQVLCRKHYFEGALACRTPRLL
jgi:thymidine kinase